MQRVQRGFSLMEVMVAGVITSAGLAGIAGLLLTSVLHTGDAGEQLTASLLTAKLAANISMARAAGPAWLAEPPAIAPDCAAPAGCDPASFAAHSLRRWQTDLTASLPGSQGLVCRDSTPVDGTPSAPACDGQGAFAIKLFWHDAQGEPSRLHRFVRIVAP